MKKITIQDDLKKLLEDIDVSDANYEKAEKRYKSISSYIKDSNMSALNPDIYLQGSFKLGTAVKPLTDEGSYDIDIVCNFTKLRRSTQSQFRLKYDLGQVIKGYVKSNNMSNPAKESKRCWTINYVDEDNFHIDILPSVPMYDIDDGFIAITDKDNPQYFNVSNDWEISNPKGYSNWFMENSKFQSYKLLEAKRFYAKVEDIPDYKVRTPLQRIVQIFKRHAEVMFEEKLEYKPSSVIITTLATKQYRDASILHDNLLDVMTYIALNIKKGIDYKDGKPCIYNPVNKDEILSGKWDRDDLYFEEFQKWIFQLQVDLNVENQHYKDIDRISYLKRSLYKQKEDHFPVVRMEDIGHHKKIKWPFINREEVRIIARYKYKGFRYKTIKSGAGLNKNGNLKFEVKANNLKRYDIYWQVTNTGKEAINANCLRGDFYESELEEGKRIRKESTSYTGHHYVEAFLVKDGICYGKSAPFEVNIVSGFTTDFWK